MQTIFLHSTGPLLQRPARAQHRLFRLLVGPHHDFSRSRTARLPATIAIIISSIHQPIIITINRGSGSSRPEVGRWSINNIHRRTTFQLIIIRRATTTDSSSTTYPPGPITSSWSAGNGFKTGRPFRTTCTRNAFRKSITSWARRLRLAGFRHPQVVNRTTPPSKRSPS